MKKLWYPSQVKPGAKKPLMSYGTSNLPKLLKHSPRWITDAHLSEMEAFYIKAYKMTWRTKIKYHVDHIEPLKGKTSCGLHVPWNLRVITARENHTKQNKLLPDL